MVNPNDSPNQIGPDDIASLLDQLDEYLWNIDVPEALTELSELSPKERNALLKEVNEGFSPRGSLVWHPKTNEWLLLLRISPTSELEDDEHVRGISNDR